MSDQHVVVITGAANGIGRALAQAYHHTGSTVVLADIDSDDLRRTANEIGCLALPTDVRREEDLKALIHGARKKLGRLDVYVNNAGVGYNGPVAEGDLDQWREMIDTNLWGVMIGTREALKVMRQQGGGDIVFIDSQAGRVPVPNMAVYAATKWGIRGFADVVFRESFRTGVRVIIIEPGAVETEFFASISPAGRRQLAGGSLLTPEAVADLVVFSTRQDRRVLVHEVKLGAVQRNGGEHGSA